MISARTRFQAARESALRRAKQAPPTVLRVVTGFLRKLANIEPFDRAMTLAAQSFTSIFPLLISVAAFHDKGDDTVADQISHTLSLSESTTKVLNESLPAGTQQHAAFGILSVLIVLISATSLSRALGRMYAKAWLVPPSGWGGGWRWIAVILAICASTMTTQWMNRSADEVSGTVAALGATFLLNTMLWAWVPWLLLVRRITVVHLLPAAALMGIGSVGLYLASSAYMPHALELASEQFGAFGLAFTLIGWLFVASFVLIVATVLGAAVALDPSVEGFVLALRRLPERLRSDVRALWMTTGGEMSAASCMCNTNVETPPTELFR